MQRTSRLLAIALSGIYGVASLPFVFSAMSALSAALADAPGPRINPWPLLAPGALFLAITAALLSAAVGLFKEKAWARWPFLAVALLALAMLAYSLKVAVFIDPYHASSSAEDVVAAVLLHFERVIAPSAVLALFTACAALFVFHRSKARSSSENEA